MRLENYNFPIQLGGHLCLNFTNTAEFRHTDHPVEFLHSYQHVLAWCWRNSLLTDAEASRLQAESAKKPVEAETAYHAAFDLREILFRIFTSVIDGHEPSADDLARLNETLALSQRRIESGKNGFHWAWANSSDLSCILAPIALAAAELLTSDQLERVRQCPNCGWLFVDTSRNHTRRWCSMDFCGSKVKSHRQYERRKQSQA